MKRLCAFRGLLSLALVLLTIACGGDDGRSRGASEHDAMTAQEAGVGGGADGGTHADCIELSALRSYPADPSTSALAVLFKAMTCSDKRPVPRLQEEQVFELQENGQKLSQEAVPYFGESRGRRVYLTLLLDMSSSTRPVLDSLVAGAKNFVAELLDKRKINVFIGIEVFDGAPSAVTWQLPIRSSERLRNRLDELKTYAGVDPSSTNLNGAIKGALDKLQARQRLVVSKNDNGVATQGYLVLFTDGLDSAGLVPAAVTRDAIANANAPARLASFDTAPVDTYAVALKGLDYNPSELVSLFTGRIEQSRGSCSDSCLRARNGVCEDGHSSALNSSCELGTDCTDCGPRSTATRGDAGILGDAGVRWDAGTRSADGGVSETLLTEARRRVVEADNEAQLSARFSELASEIAGQLEGTYLMVYCSPKRTGNHKLTVGIKPGKAPTSVPLELDFSADSFKPGCSVDLFKSACDSKTCGGFNCGACDDETEVCDAASDQCENACVASGRCDGSAITNPLGYEQKCEPEGTLKQCGAQCADLQTDERNCGMCGASCQTGASCLGGACASSSVNLTECTNGCFDLETDKNHCGSCTTICPGITPVTGMATACTNGVCDCGAGYALCNNSCVSPSTDRYNCGGCGIQCSSDSSCVLGQCVCNSTALTSCQMGSTAVPSCVNLQTSAQSCGMCGKSCGDSSTCNAGQCTCTGSSVACNRTCALLASDPKNCGVCGRACGLGEVCQASVCTPAPFASCVAATLSSDLPLTYSGSLEANTGYLPCTGGNVAPQKVLQFVAPKTGPYTFKTTTPGASLELDSGICTSTQMQSCGPLAILSLQQSESRRVVVYGGASAPAGTVFTLTVTGP